MANRLEFQSANFAKEFDALLVGKREADSDVQDTVAAIIDDVREKGDSALLALTAKFDNLDVANVSDLAVSATELNAALDGLNKDLRSALELAASRIHSFHEKQLPRDFAYQDQAGVELGMRYTPVDAVGLYVPGGKAAYPSSVLMNAIPALVAGVGRRVMVVPSRDGVLNPLVLAAAALAGVNEVWCIGGAQAVAALASAGGGAVIRVVHAGDADAVDAPIARAIAQRRGVGIARFAQNVASDLLVRARRARCSSRRSNAGP